MNDLTQPSIKNIRTDKRSKGPEYWQAHMDALKQSGMTKTGYCMHHGLSTATFFKWEKKLAKASALFVPAKLETVPVYPASSNDLIRIDLPNGCVISLPVSCSPTEGLRWIETLMRASC
ncbi:MAG: hypothetical protein OEZ58_14890 [Gammaproteobacteria bacterium]|nr:hypothetical protein [Gammaproteobacteria bacterium]MDH5730281.1 hypothetical protein [Gammaproteobacteria bacterium]